MFGGILAVLSCRACNTVFRVYTLRGDGANQECPFCHNEDEKIILEDHFKSQVEVKKLMANGGAKS